MKAMFQSSIERVKPMKNGQTNEKWRRILNVLTNWKGIECFSLVKRTQEYRKNTERIQKEYRKTHASEQKEDRAIFTVGN